MADYVIKQFVRTSLDLSVVSAYDIKMQNFQVGKELMRRVMH